MNGLVIVIHLKEAEAAGVPITIDNEPDGEIPVLILEAILRNEIIKQVLYDLLFMVLIVRCCIVVLQHLFWIAYHKPWIILQAIKGDITYIFGESLPLRNSRHDQA